MLIDIVIVTVTFIICLVRMLLTIVSVNIVLFVICSVIAHLPLFKSGIEVSRPRWHIRFRIKGRGKRFSCCVCWPQLCQSRATDCADYQSHKHSVIYYQNHGEIMDNMLVIISIHFIAWPLIIIFLFVLIIQLFCPCECQSCKLPLCSSTDSLQP